MARIDFKTFFNDEMDYLSFHIALKLHKEGSGELIDRIYASGKHITTVINESLNLWLENDREREVYEAHLVLVENMKRWNEKQNSKVHSR